MNSESNEIKNKVKENSEKLMKLGSILAKNQFSYKIEEKYTMKFVITGALGHIGSQLIRELPKMFPNAEIVMIDNLSTQRYCSFF